MKALPVILGILVVVMVLFVVALVLLRRRMAQEGVYLFPRTKFGWALVFNFQGDDGEPVRVLNVGGMYQSATFLDDRYADLIFSYDKLYDLAFEANPQLSNLAMIGGGGYAYPKHLIAHHPLARIDVVEVDPKITSIAQRYFFVDRLEEEFDTRENGRLGLICADGRAWLEGGTGADESEGGSGKSAPYGAILNDTFCGKTPAWQLATAEAAAAIHANLTPDGVYMSNVVDAVEGDGARFLRAVVRTLSAEFKHVWVVPCGRDELADRDNNIVVATDADLVFSGAREVETSEADPLLTDANAKGLIRELTK